LEFTQETKQDNDAETNMFTAQKYIIQKGTNTGNKRSSTDETERKERARETSRLYNKPGVSRNRSRH
jgi:hypothetical protein